MSNDMTLAQALFGSRRQETEDAGNQTLTVYAVAVSDSSDGVVEVELSDYVIGDDDIPDVAVEVPTTVAVEEGDEVIVTLFGGSEGKTPVVTGLVGGGDAEATEIREAGEAADAAQKTADEAILRIGTLEADHVSTSDLTAVNASIDSLEVKDAAIEGDLTAASGRIGALEADHVKVADFKAEQANIDNLQAATADIDAIRANSAKVQNLTAEQLEADHATIGTLDTTYMHANMSNSDVAWISNGTIKDGAITNAMIDSVSANKLTAGTIDASDITVTNLNADNITAGTINGERIGDGSLSLDKLSEDVYTETEVDAKLSSMQDQIDGAIETWTGTAVPTLNNKPASDWKTAAVRDKHVGDVYFVVNSDSKQNGYNYRFTKSGSTYSWQLIKDSDVTNALQRLTAAEGKITTFESDISTLKTDTGTLTTRTTSLETRVDGVDSALLDKVDVSDFNEVSDTVDAHTQTLTQHASAISKKADSSTVTALTTRVNKTETDISGINTTIGELQTTVESKADGSALTTVSNKLNTVSDTVDGHTQTLTSVQNTLGTKADSSTVSTLSTKVNTVSDTVDGHTSQLSSITSTQTTMQGTLDKTVKSSIQLWYSKANTTAPSKPTAKVTSTSTAGNAWRIVVPAYNATYPHYYYCWQYEYVDGTYGWSAVVRDIAMGESQSTARTANTNASDAKTAAATASTTASEAKTTAETAASDASTAKTNAASAVSAANSASTTATNAQTTANANIKSSVQLWFTKANSTAPSKPTSVVSTSNANTANAWNLVVPVWNKNYPHYFYCYQQQKGDGTYQWTDVVYDRATSEAQQLANTTSTNLSTLQTDYATFKQTTTEFESTVGSTYATKTEVNSIQIGGRNLLRGTSTFRNHEGDMGSMSSSPVSGGYCGSASHIESKGAWSGVGIALHKVLQRVGAKIGDTITMSIWVSTDSETEVAHNIYLYRAKTNSSTPGINNPGGTNLYATITLVKGQWQRVYVTFEVTDFALNTNKTTRFETNKESTDYSLFWAAPKIEFGSKPTDWTPAPEDIETRVSSAETAIEQNAENITLNASKLETVATPNLSPFLESEPYRTAMSYSGGYWQPTADNWLMAVLTRLDDGWAHASVGNSKRFELAVPRIESLEPGDKATLLVEWRDVTVTGSPKIYARNYPNNCQFNNNTYAVTWTASTPSSGKKYIAMTVNSSADGTAAWNAAINFAMTNGSSVSFDGDVRVSLYAGEYSGPYKPYVGEQLYASQAELKVTNDSISSKVSTTDYTGAKIASLINQSADTVTIEAEHIDLNGSVKVSDLSQDTKDSIDDAAKTATDFVTLDAGGIVVGKLTDSTLGKNVLIDSDSVDIRNGSDVLASFGETTVIGAPDGDGSVLVEPDRIGMYGNSKYQSGNPEYTTFFELDKAGMSLSSHFNLDGASSSSFSSMGVLASGISILSNVGISLESALGVAVNGGLRTDDDEFEIEIPKAENNPQYKFVMTGAGNLRLDSRATANDEYEAEAYFAQIEPGSGVMKDHIIEVGSNGNTNERPQWRWIKFASGYAIAWGYYGGGSWKAETAWGSLYFKETSRLANPFTWAGAPYEWMQPQGTAYFWCVGHNAATTTQTGTYYLVTPTKQTTARAATLNFLQIGRWK